MKISLWCVFSTFSLILLIVVNLCMLFFPFISNDEGSKYPFDLYNDLNYGPYFLYMDDVIML